MQDGNQEFRHAWPIVVQMLKLASTSITKDAERLAIEVKTSSRIIHRGSKFNIHISIQNLLNTPISDIAWGWTLPPGLVCKAEGLGNNDIKSAVLQPKSSCSLVFILEAIGVGAKLPWKETPTEKTPAEIGENFISMNISFTPKGGDKNYQEVQSVLNIYAAAYEIYVGGIIGAIAGSFVKKPTLSYEFAISAVISVILGFFLVLIAKRRTDVQFGFSIEDWAGGAIVGFLVGYLGTSYFEKFLPEISSLTPTPTPV